jgi:hypothetical protein
MTILTPVLVAVACLGGIAGLLGLAAIHALLTLPLAGDGDAEGDD